MRFHLKTVGLLLALTSSLVSVNQLSGQANVPEQQSLKIKIEFGHQASKKHLQSVQLKSGSPGLSITETAGSALENEDRADNIFQLYCGAGDVDAITATVNWPKPTAELRKAGTDHTNMWNYFFDNGSPGQIKRLLDDPWQKPDAPLLTVELNNEGTKGFSVGLEQLIRHRAMWLPEQHIYITLAENPVDFESHMAGLQGMRTLDRIKSEPDASLEQWQNNWTNFGNPLVDDPSWKNWQTEWMGTTGHLIVTAAAHGSIYKFAIDRWGNVRPDFASPYKFRLNFNWKNSQWKMQEITNGLPVVLTRLEKNGQFCEIEQFATPVDAIDAAAEGYIPGAMFSKIVFSGQSGDLNFSFNFKSEAKNSNLKLTKTDNNWIVTNESSGNIVLMLETDNNLAVQFSQSSKEKQEINMELTGKIRKGKSNSLLVKMPSPELASSLSEKLEKIDFAQAKNQVINYWENWLNKGAQFHVPEEKVNELFRANLWHALVLPRHTIGTDNEPHMDIPYANTAYGQHNADWPINQAVYVDYMIYGLRNYTEAAEKEIAAMFKTQQQENGRIGGYANWGVYSPGHLYAIAQLYLLSRNNEQFERLLPDAMKTLDWCISEIKNSGTGENNSGLILAPLNDNSPAEHEWAFTQAYFAGGLELFGKALEIYGHERAGEVNETAQQFKADVIKAFSRNSVQTPIVQLEDGTWINYVSTDAMTNRRMIDQWYPTDVDTGPLHLARLGVFDAWSWLTTAMLNDHEDNLFIHQWGAANEPVYMPQANAYLLIDEPKAAIRSFYSMMACAFSHNQLTSLEHRWAHPIYYSPPSTDGAWFEIYRKMLVNEWGTDTLFIGQATPRKWLQDGKKIEVKDAPTYFGPVSFTINSKSSENKIQAELNLSERNLPKNLLIRFRHPDGSPIRSVVLNGKNWELFDLEKELVRIPQPQENHYNITVNY